MPLSLAFALTIGWFNGTIVDKTGLPSFIVTLGSYFVLIGAKLSFSKMFVGQVTVAGLDKADGFSFWRQVFAASWIRNDHLWESRDTFWTALVIAAGVLVVVGVIELSYQRAPAREASGLIALLVGVVVGLVGFFGLLNTDGVGANTVFGLLMGDRDPGGRDRVGSVALRPAAPQGRVPDRREGWSVHR